jgi:shikimate 5-dehydrogenase
MASQEEILEENRKVRRLQIVVNLILNVVAQTDMPIEEASELVAQTRRFALDLFPDKELAYDIIYQPKFKRLLAEKYRIV